MGDEANSSFHLEADSYRPVWTPALDDKHNSDVVTDSSENAGTDTKPKRWQRLLREYRVVEYAFAIVLYVIARRLGAWMKMHERTLPRIEMRLNSTTSIWGRDPAMDQEKLSEQVPMYMLIIVSLAIAIGINLLINYVCPMFIAIRAIAHDFRDFLLSLGQAITLSTFLVNVMKNMTGRFRPCFYAMRGWNYDFVWDGITDLCSDSDGDDEGRKSFPSGHSSFAWSVMGVLTLYLLGRARLTRAPKTNRFSKKECERSSCFSASCLVWERHGLPSRVPLTIGIITATLWRAALLELPRLVWHTTTITARSIAGMWQGCPTKRFTNGDRQSVRTP